MGREGLRVLPSSVVVLVHGALYRRDDNFRRAGDEALGHGSQRQIPDLALCVADQFPVDLLPPDSRVPVPLVGAVSVARDKSRARSNLRPRCLAILWNRTRVAALLLYI